MARDAARALVAEVTASLASGGVTIRSIRSTRTEHLRGLCDIRTGAITINPVLDLVDVAIHECLHRVRPRWSERAVLAQTHRVLAHMTYAEIEALYVTVVKAGLPQPKPRRRLSGRSPRPSTTG